MLFTEISLLQLANFYAVLSIVKQVPYHDTCNALNKTILLECQVRVSIASVLCFHIQRFMK